MLVRIISAVVAIPLLLFFIIVGGVPLKIATLVISLIGMYELYNAVSGKIKAVHIVGFLLEIAYVFLLCGVIRYVNAWTQVLMFCMATIVMLAIMVIDYPKTDIKDVSITMFGVFYLGIILSLISEIRKYSPDLVWLPFIFAFGSDTGAYFVGSAIGKHKLTPQLSPKKSVEGAIGGVVTAAVLSGIYAFICYNYYKPEYYFAPSEIVDSCAIYVSIVTIMGAIGSVFGQFGDLAASAIKRQVGIKDYGKIMPGHGGVLDRFDSVIFTIPPVCIYLAYVVVPMHFKR